MNSLISIKAPLVERVRLIGGRRDQRFKAVARWKGTKTPAMKSYEVYTVNGVRVGVVGAGGTGSAVIEQLARLGVGELVIFDDDTIDETNLTRIHGATVADVGRAKAELAAWSAALKVTQLGNRGIPTLDQLERARASGAAGGRPKA